jgi:hypothetical protein
VENALTFTLTQTTMNDAETRAEPINPAIAAAGWGVVEAKA